MYVDRTLEAVVLRATEQFPVVFLTGARQVGKTTLLRQISAGDRTYVTLDDPLVASLARTDPPLFMQRFPPPVLIDEVQYAPEIFPHIKMSVDRARRPGMFWISGSQQFHLMKDVSESLAGRVAVVHLLGLSRSETVGRGLGAPPFVPTPDEIERRTALGPKLTLQQLYRTIWRGALPAIALDDTVERDLFFGSYVQTYLQRDVRDLARVGDEMAFVRFLRATAARTGQLLNLADLARDADVAPNTAKSWLSILGTAGIVHLLEPFHTNVGKRSTSSTPVWPPT
jgi:predicted AAA+ superfamily ATPase